MSQRDNRMSKKYKETYYKRREYEGDRKTLSEVHYKSVVKEINHKEDTNIKNDRRKSKQKPSKHASNSDRLKVPEEKYPDHSVSHQKGNHHNSRDGLHFRDSQRKENVSSESETENYRRQERERYSSPRNESYEELSKRKQKIESELHALDMEEAAEREAKGKKGHRMQTNLYKSEIRSVRIKKEPVEDESVKSRKHKSLLPDNRTHNRHEPHRHRQSPQDNFRHDEPHKYRHSAQDNFRHKESHKHGHSPQDNFKRSFQENLTHDDEEPEKPRRYRHSPENNRHSSQNNLTNNHKSDGARKQRYLPQGNLRQASPDNHTKNEKPSAARKHGHSPQDDMRHSLQDNYAHNHKPNGARKRRLSPQDNVRHSLHDNHTNSDEPDGAHKRRHSPPDNIKHSLHDNLTKSKKPPGAHKRKHSPQENVRRASHDNNKERYRHNVSSQSPADGNDWGKMNEVAKKEDKPVEKPNFAVSGKLAEDTNTYNGVVIKYNEPAEARKPKRKWRLYPFKGDTSLPFLPIHRQSAYLFGRTRLIADIPIDHPSCSKQHAVLQFRLVSYKRDDGSTGKRVRPYIIDLESSNGTFVNNKKIDPRRYMELMEKDVVKFGFSSREYVVLHEESKKDFEDDDVLEDKSD